MPLLHTKQLNPNTVLGIWQTKESLHELQAMLPPQADYTQIEQVNEKRKKEWLASRVLVYTLLRQFTAAPAVLLKNEYGKPYFAGHDIFVSISHSPTLAAVIISDKHEVGIDIEPLSQKALRVSGKFLSEAEKTFTNLEESQTCLYWSAKETLYKLYSRKQLIFKENLILAPTGKQNALAGQIITADFSKLYQIRYEFLQNHVLTYSVDDIES